MRKHRRKHTSHVEFDRAAQVSMMAPCDWVDDNQPTKPFRPVPLTLSVTDDDTQAKEGTPMKFLTKAIEHALPALYAQEDLGDDAIVHAKWFAPWTNWTWYATEYDPETSRCFGLVVGHETELGYFMLSELQAIEGPGGIRIERDRYFRPVTITRLREML